jgi:hypothetical protein
MVRAPRIAERESIFKVRDRGRDQLLKPGKKTKNKGRSVCEMRQNRLDAAEGRKVICPGLMTQPQR